MPTSHHHTTSMSDVDNRNHDSGRRRHCPRFLGESRLYKGRPAPRQEAITIIITIKSFSRLPSHNYPLTQTKMQFTTALTLLMGAITVSATPTPAVANSSSDADSMVILSNNWRMETWSGTSCTGTHLFWTAPDGGSCTNMAAVSSLRVTNFGGCSSTSNDAILDPATVYFLD
jgi:hypothetical protein